MYETNRLNEWCVIGFESARELPAKLELTVNYHKPKITQPLPLRVALDPVICTLALSTTPTVMTLLSTTHFEITFPYLQCLSRMSCRLTFSNLTTSLKMWQTAKSIKSSDQELEALLNLETVCSKVKRVVWIYLWPPISLHLVEDVPSASLKSKFSMFTQSTVLSLQILLQEWNQSWKHTEKEKPSAKERV